jgi:hypothetical protein
VSVFRGVEDWDDAGTAGFGFCFGFFGVRAAGAAEEEGHWDFRDGFSRMWRGLGWVYGGCMYMGWWERRTEEETRAGW